MASGKITYKKRILFSSVVILFILGMMLTGLELVLRFDQITGILRGDYQRRVMNLPDPVNRADEMLGWYPKENFQSEVKQFRDLNNQEYDIKYSTNDYGFRKWGDLSTDKKKILIVGDSFTQAELVSDKESYYEKLGGLVDYEIFAFGCVGYGTLQEYLVLRKFVDMIRPDLIIIQFCGNDFVNNSYHFSNIVPHYHHGTLSMPFMLENGEIRMSSIEPDPYGLPLARYWSKFRLRSLFWIDKKLKLAFKPFEHSQEFLVEYGMAAYIKKNPYKAALKESIVLTEQIFRRIRNEFGKTAPILVFSVNSPEYIAEICKRVDISYSDRVYQSVRSIEYASGHHVPLCRVDRPWEHYNNLGHTVVASALAEEIPKYLRNGSGSVGNE